MVVFLNSLNVFTCLISIAHNVEAQQAFTTQAGRVHKLARLSPKKSAFFSPKTRFCTKKLSCFTNYFFPFFAPPQPQPQPQPQPPKLWWSFLCFCTKTHCLFRLFTKTRKTRSLPFLFLFLFHQNWSLFSCSSVFTKKLSTIFFTKHGLWAAVAGAAA